MQITLMPDLHGSETRHRIIDSKHVTSVECIGKKIVITTDNGTSFIEHHSSHEEAERRYDDFCILWAAGDSSPELLESTRTHARTRTRTHARTRTRTRTHGCLKWIKLETPSNKYFFKTDDIRYVKTFPSGVRIEFNDGRSTDVMMDPDVAEKAIMEATEDWI